MFTVLFLVILLQIYILFFQYIDEPMGYFTVTHTSVAQFLSPNTVSFIGVFFALISAK